MAAAAGRAAAALPSALHEAIRQQVYQKATNAVRYRWFAQRADHEGRLRAAQLFRSLADSEWEMSHAAFTALEMLTGVDPTTSEPIGDTKKHLHASLISELHDTEETLPTFSSQVSPCTFCSSSQERLTHLSIKAHDAGDRYVGAMFERMIDADERHVAALKSLANPHDVFSDEIWGETARVRNEFDSGMAADSTTPGTDRQSTGSK